MIQFKKIYMLMALPLAVAACQSHQYQPSTESSTMNSNVEQTASVSLQQQLSQSHWQLVAAKNQSGQQIMAFNTQGLPDVVLNLMSDRLALKTGCNNIGGSYQLDEAKSTITTKHLMATRMACPSPIMERETALSNYFSNQSLKLKLDNDRLLLTDAKNQILEFKGTPTAETRYQGQPETVFLEISPETKACTGVGAQTCLQVREVKYNQAGQKTIENEQWQLFYNQIEGFKHNPDHRVVLRLKRFNVKNPAADQSKYAYVYDMAVETEVVNSK